MDIISELIRRRKYYLSEMELPVIIRCREYNHVYETMKYIFNGDRYFLMAKALMDLYNKNKTHTCIMILEDKKIFKGTEYREFSYSSDMYYIKKCPDVLMLDFEDIII